MRKRPGPAVSFQAKQRVQYFRQRYFRQAQKPRSPESWSRSAAKSYFCGHLWSDCDGEIERVFTKDELLTNISIYWFTQTIGSSMRLYWESRRRPLRFAPGERVRVPSAIAHFPKEIPMPPRSWVERVVDVQRWSKMPRGGHFAALEQPVLLARDIRSFFGSRSPSN